MCIYVGYKRAIEVSGFEKREGGRERGRDSQE